MTISEYKNEIKRLQRSLKDAELRWTSNERWIDEKALPNFAVERKYSFGSFVVNTRVSIKVELLGADVLRLSVYSQGGTIRSDNLLDVVESGLAQDRDRLLSFVEGYITT
jgi:hypothetical protein